MVLLAYKATGNTGLMMLRGNWREIVVSQVTRFGNIGYDNACSQQLSASTTHTLAMFRLIALLGLVLGCTVVAQTPAVQLAKHELSQHDDWWSVKVEYPQMNGESAFNEAIRRSVTATTDKFRKALPKTASKGYPDYGAYLKGAYTAQVLRTGIVSVLFEYDEYTPGAVHPWGVMSSVNYDTHKHRLLALADLFRPGSDYVAPLSKLAIASLDQHEYAEKEQIRRGAGPIAGNFQVFTLTDTELVLHFQQYQVAPGAEPAQQVAVPLNTLTPMLREQYRPSAVPTVSWR
jgi:hypothetical protein